MGKAIILVTNIQKSETFAFDTRGLSNLKADTKGKADWKMDLEIKDQAGEVCCLLQGVWQMRKV